MGHKTKLQRQQEAERRKLEKDIPEWNQKIDAYQKLAKFSNGRTESMEINRRINELALMYSKGLQRLEELNRLLTPQ